MSTNTYKRNGEWSGYSIHEAATGFVVDFWSRVQGQRDSLRFLVPYTAQFPKGLDLAAMWNDSTTNGEALAYIGTFNPRRKVLVRGLIVA